MPESILCKSMLPSGPTYHMVINDDDNDDDGDVDIHIIVETPLAPSLLTESKGLELVNLGVDMINIIIRQ